MQRKSITVTEPQARLIYLRRPFRDTYTLGGVVGNIKAKVVARDKAARRKFITLTNYFNDSRKDYWYE